MNVGFFARMGASDCEAIEGGFLAQPVNAVSSLAFSVVGIVILGWSARARGRERIVRLIFGVAMVATGIGSFLYHGPQGPGSQFLHDVTFLSVLWLLVVLNVVAAGRVASSVGWWAFGVGMAAFALGLIVAPDSANLYMVTLLIALVVSDIGLGRKSPHRTGIWFGSMAVIVLAALAFVVGRTDGLLCDPESIGQPHALWHLLGALALWGYFVSTTAVRSRDDGGW